jgi:hypothetical protein
VRRIEGALGAPGVVDAVSPASLVRAHFRNPLVRPSTLDPRALRACERQLNELLPDGYERIDLAPVTPFGGAHVLGSTPQDWVVSAVRFGLEPGRQGGEPGYYVRTCFGLWSGEANLADGGFTDWSARLLGDRKERVLTSGIGLDRLVG